MICCKGTIDVIVGINLLREGLDLPEVSLVAILDADKEGFLRSETSLRADHWTCRAQCGRRRYHVCGFHHALNGARYYGD